MSRETFMQSIKVLFVMFCATQTAAKSFELHFNNPEEYASNFEGDLIMRPTGRNGKKNEALRWKKGEIPYVISSSFSEF